MNRRALIAAAWITLAPIAYGQETPKPQSETQKVLSSIDWVAGPGEGKMTHVASIKVPEGYVFAKASDVPKLMEMMENPVSGNEVGLLAPQDFSWFMLFEFDPVGYVKDDERDKLDAEAILNNVKEGTAAANEERKRRGWGALEIVGWEQKPKYDAATNNLTWAIRARSSEGDVVNYNTRILGREGVMEVALVCDPPQLTAVMPSATQLLNDYSFNPGKRYAEFRQGDKVAEYGLAALIAGGGVAVAAKTGVLAKLGKLLAKVGIFVAAALAALAKKVFGKKEPSTP